MAFTYPLRDPKLKRFISHRIHGFLVYLPTNVPLSSTISVGKYTLYMGVSKSSGKTTKMDGENHGNPYEQMGWFGW